MIEITVKFGENMVVTAKGDDRKQALTEIAFFSALPKVCPVCKADVSFYYRNPQTFNYWGLRCEGPTPHISQFGQRKEGGVLFYYSSKKWEIDNYARDDHHEDDGSGDAGDGRPPWENAPSHGERMMTDDQKKEITRLGRAKMWENQEIVNYVSKMSGGLSPSQITYAQAEGIIRSLKEG